MKRLPILALLGALLFSVPLLAPGAASAHPGNTCNPPAGHGNSGCHRVAASAPSPSPRPASQPKARVKKAPSRRVARRAAPAPAPAPAPVVAPVVETPITDADLGAAFFGTQPGYGGRGDR